MLNNLYQKIVFKYFAFELRLTYVQFSLTIFAVHLDHISLFIYFLERQKTAVLCMILNLLFC